MTGDRRVALNVSTIIDARGLKKCKVAMMADIKPQQFSSMLHGRKKFDSDHILSLSKALGVTPNDLLRTPG